MEIKPVKLIKSVSGSTVGAELDVVNKPKTPATPLPKLPEGLELRARALLIDGQDVGLLISKTAQDNPQLLAALAGKLEAYKMTRLKRRNLLAKNKGSPTTEEDDELSLVWALCDTHIARIGQLIKRRYDQTKDGLTVFFDEEGQLIVNGLNVNAFIENSREHPSVKTRVLLRGLRTRIGYILHNRNGNPYYIQIREAVLELYNEIEELLQ